MVQTLKRNSVLAELILDGNPIGPDGAKALMRVQMVSMIEPGARATERSISLAGSARTHTLRQIDARARARARSHARTHACTHARARACAHRQIDTHTLALARSHTRTHSRTHAHIPTHWHARARARAQA